MLPISRVAHLFPVLDNHLMSLLRSLTDEEWNAPTLARRWTVKDVAAHLLDGNIRTLSMQRDGYFGVQPTGDVSSYHGLVTWLNELNNDWVAAARRISPAVMILLHEATGRLTNEYYASLHLHDKAIFSVGWAGEEESLNWMHLAREYTEKWHHQQQIRHAVGRTAPLMSRELFFPLIDTFMRALPHTYRSVDAPSGTVIRVVVTGEAGGNWYVLKNDAAWELIAVLPETPPPSSTSVSFPPETAWMLFTKGITAEAARAEATVIGDERLAAPVFSMLSVMA
jgi:uncharacterized protein (TIGR03083 family)